LAVTTVPQVGSLPAQVFMLLCLLEERQ
jgi:hypothetical protein